MCILFIYMNPTPSPGGYRLIIASNRDEYYCRPSELAYKCDKTGIIGGRDMTSGREGGMWLGITVKPPKLSFAALLNVTGECKKTENILARGPIVYNYLKNGLESPHYIEELQSHSYNAFNVVMINLKDGELVTYHHSNTPDKTYKYSGKQALAFGNSTPETPLTKVIEGREEFEQIIEAATDKEQLKEQLIDLLKSKNKHLPDAELQRRAPDTFEGLSSIYVEIGEAYGTRAHSIILVDDQGNVDFVEHSMKEFGNDDWNITQFNSHL